MRTYFLVSIMLASVAWAGEHPAVENPGFEVNQDGDEFPDGWRISWRSTHSDDGQRRAKKQEPDWAWDRDTSHSGNASIRCGVKRQVDDGVWTQEHIAVPAGTRFLKITASIKAANMDRTDGRVAVVFLDQKRGWLNADYSAITVPHNCDWTTYTGYVHVPQDAAWIRLRCWVNFRYTGTGTCWFDDLKLEKVDEIKERVTVYKDDRPSRPATDQEQEWGFMAFSRNYLRTLFPNAAVESDETHDLEVALCPGEFEPMTLALRPFHALKNVRLTVTDFAGDHGVISAEQIDVRAVRFHPKKGQSRWGPFHETLMDVPLFLEAATEKDLAPDHVQPYWVTVHAPADTTPGQYQGAVIVHVNGERRARLPARIHIHPFHLATPKGRCFAMYTRMRADPEWIAETFADMRAHGMSSVALCGNSGLDLKRTDQGVEINWNGRSELERNMDAYVKAGFEEPMVWLMGGDIPRFCEQIAPLDSKEFADCYRALTQQIIAHGERAGWPEIIFQPIDEPFGHPERAPRALRLLEVLKTVPGLRTEEDGMDANWDMFMRDFYSLTDVLVLHDGPTLDRGVLDLDRWWSFLNKAERDHKTIWFYNIDLTAWHPEPMRYMYGFGLWKSQAKGTIEWAYMWPVDPEAPEKVYDNPEGLLFRFPRAGGKSGGPTIGYEAIREGIDDYRYLLTLQQLVDKAEASGCQELRALAKRVWSPIGDKLDKAGFECCTGRAAQGHWTGKCAYLPNGNRAVHGDHKIDNNWQFDDYDQLRDLIAEGIMKLQKELNAKK